MSTTDPSLQEPDPRARWRRLPPAPSMWIEEKPVEPTAVSYAPETDPVVDASRYGG
ncbi:hypothetical protein NDR87_34460 [Nocardia sp. CDC159]|uniref:Uncharacterized protein n=1 Tax=Nocardia pulmonis TaxID=2951408 RepID=A0A9X2EDY7_9NOCA|nr:MULTISPECIES: hypothetical protein [Nocardia]MCM6778596.1 hypothetical protein [Nocardia pulmonis]MCM6791485.1 hypothetical protein [Nocardia sp. CDC159]